MNWCRYCNRPCGQREFCDEICYEEYNHDMAELQASMAQELPGEPRYDWDDEPPVWDVQGGL
jgi:hypothetical protein